MPDKNLLKDEELYSPTDEYDELKKDVPRGMGWSRELAVEAINEKSNLKDLEAIESLTDLNNALLEMSLAEPDGRIHIAPPNDAIETANALFEDLPEDARSEFLADRILLRRINAARKSFNRYLSQRKRVKSMPSPVEAGPANYPVKKSKRRLKSMRKGSDDFEERITKVRAGLNGAKARALESIGSSVAEQTEQKRECRREQKRNNLQRGDIVLYRNPHLHAGAVHRVNKKSVRVQRQNPFKDSDSQWASDEEFTRDTIKLDSTHLTKLTPEQIESQEYLEDSPHSLDRGQSIPKSLEEAQIQMLGEVVKDHPDITTSSEDRNADDEDHPPTAELVESLQDTGVSSRAAENLANEFFDIKDIVNHSDEQLKRVKYVGPKTIEKIRSAFDTTVTDYTIIESEDGYTVAEWTEEADPEIDIRAGEIILRELVSNEFGHQNSTIRALTDWATEARKSPDNTVAKELLEAIRKLTSKEVNFATLDEDNDQKEATLKARGILAFCDSTSRTDLLHSAISEAAGEIKADREKKKEEEKKLEEGQQLLENPPDSIGSWSLVDSDKHDASVAYKGWVSEEGPHCASFPAVVVVRDDGEFVRSEGFNLAEWHSNMDSTRDASPSVYPEGAQSLREAAGELAQWLRSNSHTQPESAPDRDTNGWLLTAYKEGALAEYQLASTPGKLTITPQSVKIYRDGNSKELDQQSWEDALESGTQFLIDNMDPEGGGPDPDSWFDWESPSESDTSTKESKALANNQRSLADFCRS